VLYYAENALENAFLYTLLLTWSKAVPERSCKMKARSTIGSTESHAVCMQAFDLAVQWQCEAFTGRAALQQTVPPLGPDQKD